MRAWAAVDADGIASVDDCVAFTYSRLSGSARNRFGIRHGHGITGDSYPGTKGENSGHSQGVAYRLPHQFPTLPG
jgi:hypothetical protein